MLDTVNKEWCASSKKNNKKRLWLPKPPPCLKSALGSGEKSRDIGRKGRKGGKEDNWIQEWGGRGGEKEK